MKLLMSLRRNALGWRIQPVLFVGPKLMNLDTGPPFTVPETEEMWVETDSEILWQQQVDDHVCLFHEEWSDHFGNTRDNITAYVNFNQSKDTGLTATKMTRNDELLRHLIPESEWPRFLQATVAEWTAIWILLRSPSFHQQQQRTYENIYPIELCPPDMCTVRSLVKELEQLQKPNVDGVFLVIVTQTYATLNDLLQHHKLPQYTPFCLLRQFSNVKSLLEISSHRLCRVTRMSLTDQRVNCMRVFHLEAFRCPMGRGRSFDSAQRCSVWTCQRSLCLEENNCARH